MSCQIPSSSLLWWREISSPQHSPPETQFLQLKNLMRLQIHNDNVGIPSFTSRKLANQRIKSEKMMTSEVVLLNSTFLTTYHHYLKRKLQDYALARERFFLLNSQFDLHRHAEMLTRQIPLSWTQLYLPTCNLLQLNHIPNLLLRELRMHHFLPQFRYFSVHLGFPCRRLKCHTSDQELSSKMHTGLEAVEQWLKYVWSDNLSQHLVSKQCLQQPAWLQLDRLVILPVRLQISIVHETQNICSHQLVHDIASAP